MPPPQSLSHTATAPVAAAVVTLWRCGERIGWVDRPQTDQPWIFASLHGDHPEVVDLLERASHFLTHVIEQLPDVEDPIEDDRAYDLALRERGLSDALVDGFLRGPWVLRCGEEEQVIQVHSLASGMLQWRGPEGLQFFG